MYKVLQTGDGGISPAPKNVMRSHFDIPALVRCRFIQRTARTLRTRPPASIATSRAIRRASTPLMMPDPLDPGSAVLALSAPPRDRLFLVCEQAPILTLQRSDNSSVVRIMCHRG